MRQDRRIEMLGTDEPDAVAAVIADLLAAGAGADWDDLVAGYTAEAGYLSTTRRPGPLRVAEPESSRLVTIAALAGHAPGGTAAASMREQIEFMAVTGPRPDAPADLTPLALLPGLRHLRLEQLRAPAGLGAVIAAGRLTGLHLRQVAVDRLDLAPLTGLQSLWVQDVDGLTRLGGLSAALRELTVHGLPDGAVLDVSGAVGLVRLQVTKAPLPRPAEALRQVRDLQTDRYDRDWLAAQTAVEKAYFWNLASTEPLNAMTELRTLSIARNDNRTELTPLDLPRLETLGVYWIAGLTSLAGLAGGNLPAVRTVNVSGDALVSLDGLAVTPGVTGAEIAGDALSDIGALAGWAELAELSLHCPRLTDVTPLAKLTNLRTLDLKGCRALKDLSPLAELHLTALNVSGTAATRTTIPEALHPVVHPPSTVAVKRRPAAGRPAPAPPPGDTRKSFARLKKLVLTRDRDQLNQGLELLRAAADPDLFEAFLSGCALGSAPVEREYDTAGWSLGWPGLPESADVIAPNALLGYGRPLRPFREAAIRALVAFAPPGSATAATLRAGLRSVVCNGQGSGWEKHPVDLAPFGELPDLEHLLLTDITTLSNRPALAGARRLRSLTLRSIEDADFRGLAAPAVTTLILADHIRSDTVVDLAGFPAVERLWIESVGGGSRLHGHAPGLSTAVLSGDRTGHLAGHLAGAPLETLTVRYHRGSLSNLAPLADTGTLRHLTVLYGDVGDLTPLTALRSLRTVTLLNAGEQRIGALARLPHLTELRLTQATLTAADLAELAEAPQLRRLALGYGVHPEGPLPPRLAQIREDLN